jgi:YVTN family beta-propeller protein
LNNGVFTTLDFPGANFTLPLDVNFNGSEIVGAYALPSSPAKTSGFTYTNGVFTSVTFPKSASTVLNGVNNTGQIVGTYSLPGETNTHVFLRTGSTFTNEDVPGAVSTGVADLNDLDEIVGGYADGEGVTHGYIETSGPFIYVAGAGGVTVLDATTDLTITTIPISGAWELAVTPDQSKIYVADLGINESIFNTVSVIDTASNAITDTIQVGPGPDGVAITPNGALVYVADNDNNNPKSNTVSVVSTVTNTVVATITVGPAPYLPKVTPDGSHVYVANQNHTISVIDTTTNTVSSTIQLSAEATGLAFTPGGAFLYVGENTSPGNVAVLAIPSNKLVTTIPLGAGTGGPLKLAISPDGAFVYATNFDSKNVSVISTATNSVVATVPVGNEPYAVAASPDGAFVYAGNFGDSTISVISTATNTVISTLPVSGDVTGIATASAPPTTQQITQPLSPTAPNTFNFGTNSFVVQYPAGTAFSGVNMTVEAVQITHQQFHQRVAGTQFANATCIAYAGAGGNCVDYEVTCSNTAGNPITCPSEATPSIAVQTSFTTLQGIVRPGFLTTPIGENDWTNIFTGFTDPTIKGRTKGFSEFVAVSLGAGNAQGLGTLSFQKPLRLTDPRVFGSGVEIPVKFRLASAANPSLSISDAVANLSVEMVANAAGQAESKVVFTLQDAFQYQPQTGYSYTLNTAGYPAGTYVLTVYGNAFAAQRVQFSVATRIATTCAIQQSSSEFSNGEAITFTAFVQPATNSTGAPTGSVTFMDSANSLFALGSASLAKDKASIKAVLSAPPDHQWVNAVYSGDNNFQPCKSPYVAENYDPSE